MLLLALNPKVFLQVLSLSKDPWQDRQSLLPDHHQSQQHHHLSIFCHTCFNSLSKLKEQDNNHYRDIKIDLDFFKTRGHQLRRHGGWWGWSWRIWWCRIIRISSSHRISVHCTETPQAGLQQRVEWLKLRKVRSVPSRQARNARQKPVKVFKQKSLQATAPYRLLVNSRVPAEILYELPSFL